MLLTKVYLPYPQGKLPAWCGAVSPVPSSQQYYASKCQADTCIHTVPLHYCFLHSARGPKLHSPEEEIASCQKNL